VSQSPARADYTALTDRMSYVLALRSAIALVVVAWAALRPEFLAGPFSQLAAGTAAYLAASVAGELVRRRVRRGSHLVLSTLLLIDGVYLAAASYATGGTQSPIRFLIYLHLVAVSLLASYRTGLKIALWHSLLLFAVLYAQAAQMLPAIDVVPGRAIEFDRMPVLNVTSFWLFALATSLFSAMNERELRQRREDLQALVDVGARLDDVGDPVQQSRIVLDGLVRRFGFERGVVLAASEGNVVLLATHGAASIPTAAFEPDWIVRRAWERRELLPVRSLDPRHDPVLAEVLPGARSVLVSPMFADGRPVGAIVVEHRARRLPGVERRIVSVLGQFASIAALNLRNAALLKHVRDLAERDALTGAANRRMFQTSLERVLETVEPMPSPDRVTAVLFIDLDDFKVVNDSLGHAAGDALLVAVTERIGGLVRQGDLVARLGGDEFAILTDDEPDLKRSRAMAERLVRELRAPYLIGEHPVSVTASIGIASARDSIDGAPDLVRNADVAMYMAKANGKSGFAIFDPGMHAAIRERHELSVELQSAVELEQLRLVYQPIVDLEDGGMAGVEALVRWQHPERGLIAPGQFIEIAEENGAILPIGRWVLGEACAKAGRLVRDGIARADLFVCVNVSAREIQEPGFVEGVRWTLQESGLEATRLVLEITETALLKATPSTIATLTELRELGVRMVIDDFGTGYFSLSHLRQFPVDALKIASEFVSDGETGSRTSALAGAIVALSHSLEIETVAEGIETAGQADRMRALGCTYGQGYFFSPPLAADELEAEMWRTAEADAELAAALEAGSRPSRRRTRPALRAMSGGAA
jgi:diguanylate cyclase (GGDEF)-like protein